MLSNKIYLTFLFILFLNCSSGPETYIIEEKDGIRIVRNISPMWENDPKVSVEFVREIGSLDGEDENLLLHRANDIARDSAGNLYILDAGNFRIQVFDNDLNYLRTIGNKGQGPGELGRPAALQIDQENNLHILDVGNSKIQVYSPEGKPVNSIKISYRIVDEMHVLSVDSYILNIIDLPIKFDDFEGGSFLKKMDVDGNISEEIGELSVFDGYSETRIGNRTNFTIDNNGNYFVIFTTGNDRFEKYDKTGKLVTSIKRPMDYEIIAPKYGAPEDGMVLPDKMWTFISSGIGKDSKNRIWICGYIRQPNSPEKLTVESIRVISDDMESATNMFQLELYDNRGVLLQVFPLNYPITKIRVIDESIFIFDIDGVTIKELKIVEN